MDTIPYFRKLAHRLNRRGIKCPDPEACPRAFNAWIQKRRDDAAVRRGDFPRSGKGWRIVPANDNINTRARRDRAETETK